MKTCPHCGQPANLTAIVDAFKEPEGWLFWGKQGERWIVCQAAGYVHFRVKLGRKDQHRLAIIRGQAQEWIAAERDADRRLALIGNSASHNNDSVYAKGLDDTEEWL